MFRSIISVHNFETFSSSFWRETLSNVKTISVDLKTQVQKFSKTETFAAQLFKTWNNIGRPKQIELLKSENSLYQYNGIMVLIRCLRPYTVLTQFCVTFLEKTAYNGQSILFSVCF